MIPQRMLTSELGGSGLKNRVIACRKRLRVNRVTHRTLVNGEVAELFTETAPSVSKFTDRAAGNLPESPAISTSPFRLECRSPFSVSEAEDGETMLLFGEQGVGTT
jgi:hypothetical protein